MRFFIEQAVNTVKKPPQSLPGASPYFPVIVDNIASESGSGDF